MNVRHLNLTQKQQKELADVRDHHPKAYVRERAAAILKVAEGQAVNAVAKTGLLKRRAADSVSAWLNRYEKEGIAGLQVRPGRGRKPAFFRGVWSRARSPAARRGSGSPTAAAIRH